MTKIANEMLYVIENENGNEGFIFRLHEMRLYDDINCDSMELPYEYIHHYHVIEKHEYELMIQLLNCMSSLEFEGEILQLIETTYEKLINSLKITSIPLIEYLFNQNV